MKYRKTRENQKVGRKRKRERNGVDTSIVVERNARIVKSCEEILVHGLVHVQVGVLRNCENYQKSKEKTKRGGGGGTGTQKKKKGYFLHSLKPKFHFRKTWCH